MCAHVIYIINIINTLNHLILSEIMTDKTKLVVFAIVVSVLTVLVSSQAIDLSPFLSASIRERTTQRQIIETRFQEGIYIFVRSNGDTITGSGPNDSIECLTYEDNVVLAIEASTGMRAGKRQYDPVKITKRIDKTSPLMHKALNNNENMEITISFYKLIDLGAVEWYTIKLYDAKLAGIKTANVEIPGGKTELLEEYSFVFGTIEWTDLDSQITHIDSWDSDALA